MNKISVFVHLSRKTHGLPPCAGVKWIHTVPDVRTCYKQKKWKAQCWVGEEILNTWTEEEKTQVITQILQAFHTKPSFTNRIEILILLHGEVKHYFSLEEISEILGCSPSCLEKHIKNQEFPAPIEGKYSQDLLWKCLLIFSRNSEVESTNNIKSEMAALCRELGTGRELNPNFPPPQQDSLSKETDESKRTTREERINATKENNLMPTARKSSCDFLKLYFCWLKRRYKRNKPIRASPVLVRKSTKLILL